MAGQLNQHPLAELVREISVSNLSGALRLTHERAQAAVYFENGEIVYAASNLRAFRLSECMRRWNALGVEQPVTVQGGTSDREFGEALIAAGAVSRNLLNELIERQVSELVFHALSWSDGLWDFDPRVRLAENTRVSVKTKELLMASARRLPDERLASRFINLDEKILPEMNAPEGINIQPTEAFVLTRVDTPLSVRELLAISGLPETETLRAVYTLALGGLLHLDNWPQAFTTQEIEKARLVQPSSVKPSESKASVQQQKLEDKSAPEARAPQAPGEEPDEHKELGELFARLSMAANYYQVLGVVNTAEAGEIKRTYHSLAKRFHPDRFRKNADAALHARVESAFAQIAQAYETLKDKKSRAVYDSKLLTQQATMRNTPPRKVSEQPASNIKTNTEGSEQVKSNAAPYEAEERFKQGLSALHQGNRALAITSFGEAARLIPSEPRYRAYYGRALAADERMRRSAESELKAAVALDGNNATYRVMLAELYYEIGLLRRAQGEVERALSINPQDKAARILFEKLKDKS